METMHEILQAVADGTIDPQEASTRIAALSAAPAGSGVERSTAQRLFVKAGGARVVIVGDSNVAEAVAEGAHRMERQGDTLLVTTNLAEGDYSTEPPRSALLNWLTSVVDRAGQTLTVRVNPGLPLRVLVVGGTLELRGVSGGTSVGIEAGSAKLESGCGPLAVDVVSGSAKVDWTFSGESSVRADMGSATVLVRPESDVRISVEAVLGQAAIKTDEGMFKALGENSAVPAVVVGEGAGSLQASTRMGSVSVTVLS